MARIPYFDPDDAPESIGQLLDQLPPLNIFMMMAHAGPALKDFVRLGNRILFDGELDPVLRELAILRVGHLCGSTYEVHQHAKIARQLEIPQGKIDATARGAQAAVFAPQERAVMAFVDDVVKNVRASDATFQPLADTLTVRQLQELVLTIGYYMMVARFLETFDVDIEGEDHPTVDLSRNPYRRSGNGS